MAYATLSDSQIDGDSPLIADTLFKLRDNPIAIANGDVGAPRIQAAALDTGVALANIGAAGVTSTYLATGTSERDWVLARTAAASVGAVGTYALLNRYGGDVALEPGDTIAGSALRYVATTETFTASPIPSGTWRCMGRTSSTNRITVFLRIS